jgi:hypothetical protein
MIVKSNFKRARAIVLIFGLLGLAACGFNQRASSVSLNAEVLLRAWKCEDPLVRAAVERPGPDGIAVTVAEKLLECPFYRDYQIEATKTRTGLPVSPEILTEIVYKIRWGIDFQYRQYEEIVLTGPKKRYFVPRILNKISPGLADLFQLNAFLADQPIRAGLAAPLIARQMQHDRRITGDELERRMEAMRTGKMSYPLWQVMIDLDAYFVAGTAFSALQSLEAGLNPLDKMQKMP